MLGFHHMRRRVHATKGIEPFPSTDAKKRHFDYFMYFVGIVAPLEYFPQIFKIYSTKSASGLALVTWVLVSCVNSLWAVYGLVHNDKQLFIANLLMVVCDVLIVIGILLY
jgi:uncharacterized protein with PQ loop repeat